MVAGDDDLVRVGEIAQEIVKFPDVAQCPVAGKVAGVDQDVSIGDLNGALQAVGVADGDDIYYKRR